MILCHLSARLFQPDAISEPEWLCKSGALRSEAPARRRPVGTRMDAQAQLTSKQKVGTRRLQGRRRRMATASGYGSQADNTQNRWTSPFVDLRIRIVPKLLDLQRHESFAMPPPLPWGQLRACTSFIRCIANESAKHISYSRRNDI